MGVACSALNTADFRASYAPPGDTACAACGGHIAPGCPRLTRYVRGFNGHDTLHYHVQHGIALASRLRCPHCVDDTTEFGPRLLGLETLRREDADDLRRRFADMQSAWLARCRHTD